MQAALKDMQKLFKRTEKVDYDIDAYASDMAAMLKSFPDPSALKGSKQFHRLQISFVFFT